jgi:hypothetical protein
VLFFFLQISIALLPPEIQCSLQVFLERKKQKKLLSPEEKTKVFPIMPTIFPLFLIPQSMAPEREAAQ